MQVMGFSLCVWYPLFKISSRNRNEASDSHGSLMDVQPPVQSGGEGFSFGMLHHGIEFHHGDLVRA